MVTSPRIRMPQVEAPVRHAPVFVTDDDLDDLASFFVLDREACRARLASYSMCEHADRWNAARPETADEITAFYRNADLYIWELLQWHSSEARRPYWEALAHLGQHFPAEDGYRRVLDFGCGVGTDGLFLAEASYDVTLMDLDGPPYRFARHRFARRGLPGRFVESRWPLPSLGGSYDIVISFDVFEHLPDPLGAAQRIIGALRPGGLLVQRAAFWDEGMHPCHLHANIARFGGMRWHIYMAGLGLRSVTPFIYQKHTGPIWILQRMRFLCWRATGIWPIVVPYR